MAVIDHQPHLALAAEPVRKGFRPASRRRTQILVGVILAAAAVGGNVAIYSSLDSRSPVLQVVRDVPAGAMVTADDLRQVDVAVDGSVRVVDASDLGRVVGQYARVRIVSGSLVVVEALQPDPLVGADSAIVAVSVVDGALPQGLRERSRVRLVIPPLRSDPEAEIVVVDGRVVGLPVTASSATGRVVVSVEVESALAPVVAAADDARIVLVHPEIDPAQAGPAVEQDGAVEEIGS